MFGQGMLTKEILLRLFIPFNQKILGLYHGQWLWLPLICAEKALHGGANILDDVKTCNFNNFF